MQTFLISPHDLSWYPHSFSFKGNFLLILSVTLTDADQRSQSPDYSMSILIHFTTQQVRFSMFNPTKPNEVSVVICRCTVKWPLLHGKNCLIVTIFIFS